MQDEPHPKTSLRSPALGAAFRSLGIWILLLYFGSQVLFSFPALCYLNFSGAFSGGS